jgi:hypothetical protein
MTASKGTTTPGVRLRLGDRQTTTEWLALAIRGKATPLPSFACGFRPDRGRPGTAGPTLIPERFEEID